MTERSYRRIRVVPSGPVTTVFLSYPERRNAMGPVMVNELLWALDDAHNAPEVRVIVLTGEGKAFCAGGDFAQMSGSSDGPTLAPKGDYADLLLALTRTEKPVIAKVNGVAMGGGLGLVAASTFAIASTEATLGTPEINVGLFPMMIMAVLGRLVPKRKLLQMMLLGEKLTAEQALKLGLLGEVVAPSDLDAAVGRLADALVSKSPMTLSLGLKAFADQEDLDLAKALPLLRERLASCLATDDASEGLMAFLEKRQPRWTGK
ncbi:MAG: enoyl-CoA hydratase-related protein [Myxococcales bacterium]